MFQLPVVIYQEPNNLFTWVDKFSYKTAKHMLKEGYSYIELYRDSSDVTYLKNKPKSFSPDTRMIVKLEDYLKENN